VAQQESILPRAAARAENPERKPWYYELNPLVAVDMGILVIFLVAMLYLMPTGQVADAGFRIQVLERAIEQVERDNQLLRTQIAQASDLRKIEYAAKDRLGMVPADRVHYAPVSEHARHLQLPQDPRANDEELPFSTRWDVIRDQLNALFGKEAAGAS
jgi:cell division protein FtsB